MNEWSRLEERRELFILKGKSNRSDLSRSSDIYRWNFWLNVDSPLGLLAYRRNSWRSSGLSTDMVSQATKSQSVETSSKSRDFRHPTPDSRRDFRQAKMRRWATAKLTSVGTSGTKRWDFRQPELPAHTETPDYQKSTNFVQVFVR